MKARQVLIILGIIILLILMYLVWMIGFGSGAKFGANNPDMFKGKKDSTKKEVLDTSIVKYVNIETYHNDTVPLTISGYGRVNSVSKVQISSEVQGKLIANIPLKKGTHFSKGQTLFSITNSDARIALKARKSNFLNLLTAILPDIQLDYNEEYNKWNDFFNSIKVDIPLPKFPGFKTVKEKNFIISKGILTEYYNILSDEEKLNKYVVSAPFTGSIIEASTDEGAIVNPGTPVLTVIRDGEMEIEVPVKKSAIEKVKVGQPVDLFENDQHFSGKVIRIGEYVNEKTQTIPVFVTLGDAEGLYNGMYLEAQIKTKGFEAITEIPRIALFNDEMIYVVKDNKLHEKHADVKFYKENTAIVTNIEDGEAVVVEPIINAEEGMEVTPIEK